MLCDVCKGSGLVIVYDQNDHEIQIICPECRECRVEDISSDHYCITNYFSLNNNDK